MKDFLKHIYKQRFCILGSIFLTLSILTTIAQPTKADTKEYGPLGPIQGPLEPIK